MLLNSQFLNLAYCLRYSKLILSLKNTPKSLFFPTSKSTIKFEVFHPTSEVTEVKGGHEK